MVLVKDLRFCQFLVLYKVLREKLFGYISLKTSLSTQWKHGFKKTAKYAFFQRG